MFRLMLKISAVLLATLPGASQASGRQLFPEAVGSQRVIYDAGTPWVMSSGAITAAISFTVADRSSMWVGLVTRKICDLKSLLRGERTVSPCMVESLERQLEMNSGMPCRRRRTGGNPTAPSLSTKAIGIHCPVV
ncbi:hypothetical protein [Dokdonella fugitiva]|jgi:hypothetical protein|uniref:hypothetical protein n=1 Tax=Dokdonella fugitiva TaxID=328517 RepID=UPI0010493594|nr:hypothetical protein [Dokdonella fugitiva]